MANLLKWIKKEIAHTLPAVLYFFLAINLFNRTFGWILQEAGSHLITFPRIVISSIIIGKVILIADALPFLNKFSNKPRIYNTVWKTAIYYLFGFIFIMVERLIPLLLKYKDIITAWQYMPQNISLPRFCTGQIWMVVLLFFFVVFHELVQGVGKDKLREMFFGR